MKLLSFTLALSLAGAALAADPPAKPAPAHKGKGDAKGKAQPAAAIVGASTALENIASMIPVGLRNNRVKFPGFEQGRPTSLVIADSMTRVDDKTLYAEGVTLHLYAEDPRQNLRVDMKSATYHLETKILTSNERTKVSRADFQIEGDSMVFDTTTSRGQMKGHVHTVVFDTSQFASKKEETATSPAPNSAAQTPAAPAAAPQTKPTSAP